MLGVTFSGDTGCITDVNIEKQMSKARKILYSWSSRKLTLIGKITIIKTLILPLFIHLFSALPNPSTRLIKTLETLLFKFIWDGKNDKIKRNTLICNYDEGGLKMVHIPSFIDYLKIKWIKRIMMKKGMWIQLFDQQFKTISGMDIAFYTKSQINAICKTMCLNLFWRDVFQAYGKILPGIYSRKEFMNQLITSYAPISEINKFKKWREVGLCYIKSLFDSTGHLHNFSFIKDRYKIESNFLDYIRLTTRFPKRFSEESEKEENAVKRLEKVSSLRFVYNILVKEKKILPYKKWQKWQSDLDDVELKLEWIHRIPFLCANETQTQNFQFRLLHRILPTNVFMKKINKTDSEMCTFCSSAPETISHLFCYCPKVAPLWNKFRKWASELVSVQSTASG